MAYGFNDDRSKVEVYSEDEIDNQLFEKAHCFDTVADMKAANILKAGMICHTSGFYSSGDGGDAWYEISATGTANEMDVIACGQLFANLIIDKNNVYISKLGAANNHDNTASIQRAFDLVNTRGTVFFDIPNSYISETVTLNKKFVSLIGSGYLKRIYSDYNGVLFQINGQGVYINGLLIGKQQSTNATEDNTVAVSIINTVTSDWYNIDAFIENCCFYCTCVGIESWGKNLYVYKTTFTHTCRGVINHDSYNGSGTPNHRGIIVDNCIFHGSMYDELVQEQDYTKFDKCGLFLDGINRNAKLSNCVFNSSSKGYMLISHGGGSISIENNIAEQTNGCMGLAIIINSESLNNISINGNSLYSNSYTSAILPKKYPLILDKTNNCLISSNSIKHYYGLIKLFNTAVTAFESNFILINKDENVSTFDINQNTIVRFLANTIVASGTNVSLCGSNVLTFSPLTNLKAADDSIIKYTSNYIDNNFNKSNTNLI